MKTNKVMDKLIEKSKNEIIASNKEENEETRSVMRNAKDNLGSVMRNAEDNLGSKIDHIVQLLSAQKPQRPNVVACFNGILCYPVHQGQAKEINGAT